MSQTFTGPKAESEATAWMQMKELEIYQGRNVPTAQGKDITLGKVVERYLKEVTPKKKGEDSERFHIRAIETYGSENSRGILSRLGGGRGAVGR